MANTTTSTNTTVNTASTLGGNKDMKNNKFAQTLVREAEAAKAAAEAKAQKDAMEEHNKKVLEEEKKFAELPQFELVETVKDMASKNGLKVVKVHVLDNPDGVAIGYAVSESDAKSMVEYLHRYGKDLTTESKVMEALRKMQAMVVKGGQMAEAGLVPERELVVDGVKYIVVNNVARSTTDGHEVANLNDCGGVNLPVTVADELLTNRIRNRK
ncbi:MAG: hypothetical protein KBT06_04450 [Prevotellaceae bacterium]|nr:hypothetical protein [Candidatus Colivivens equi]